MSIVLSFTNNNLEQLYLTGVYSITNKINGKFYIGSAARVGKVPAWSGFYNRWYNHIRQLRNNNHHCKNLQNAWNKYGPENFEFKILEFVKREDCIKAEQDYLDISDKNLRYNSRDTADSFANCIRDPETIAKIVDKNSKEFCIVSPSGEIVIGKNLKEFCRKNNLHQAGIQQVLKGNVLHCLGWTASIEDHLEYTKRQDVRGLCWDKKSNAWRLRLPAKHSLASKREVIGSFKDLDQAKLERDKLEAKHNFIFLVVKSK